jgi:hypothetical protein
VAATIPGTPAMDSKKRIRYKLKVKRLISTGAFRNGTHRKPLLIIKEIAGFSQLCDGHFRIWRAFDMLVSRDEVKYGSRKFNKPVSEFI